MKLECLDWSIIIIFLGLLLVIGYLASKGAGKNTASFFLSERKTPWWLLGISMVATTFSSNTPNLVTEMVRINGVAANWLWWSFLLSGMLTVFVYSKLWNRSKILTDNEFYEFRYSGKPARFLRVFRGIYLGVFFNVFVMGVVCLSFIKIAGVMMGVNTTFALIIASVIILFYAGLGGLKSILWTDLFQFFFAMFGAVISAVYAVKTPEVGGLSNLFNHPEVKEKLNFLPSFSNPTLFLTIFIIPIAVQWWAAWYPGSEPGGGGHIVQRMLSAKSEKHATGATLLFNFFHYAVRSWPWIIVALASIIVFPDIESLLNEYPGMNPQFVKHDLAYPAMLQKLLPAGILGIVVASLIAAFMSTIASLLNLGSSYIVNDVYGRIINKNATQKQRIFVGRISTVILMIISILMAVSLENALQAFNYILMIGAGTGLVYILRWFWWRINAYSEITAMSAAVIISIIFIFIEDHFINTDGKLSIIGFVIQKEYWDIFKFTGIVFFVTLTWIIVSYLTKPTDRSTLRTFYSKIRPGGPGWKVVVQEAAEDGIVLGKNVDQKWDVPTGILLSFLGSIAVYSMMFGIGMFLYDRILNGIIYTVIFIVSDLFMFKYWKKMKEI